MMTAPQLPRRSRVKRLFKQAVAGLAPPSSQPGILILTYHKVGSPVQGEMNVPLPEFRRQMEHIAANYRVLPLGDAVADPPADRDVVVLTFDDGYRNFYTEAYPVLRDLGLPATVYVCPEYVEQGWPFPWDRLPSEAVMDWAMLRELTGEGLVTVGSHTWSHRVLPGAPDAEVEAELTRSQQAIEEHLGMPAPDFCYPKSLWDERCKRHVGRHYATAAVGGCRKNPPQPDPLCLQRLPVVLSDTFPLFLAKLGGRLRWDGFHSAPRKLYYQMTGRWPAR